MKVKASKYNVFFRYENHMIGANTFSREFILLDSALYDLYESGEKLHSFEELVVIHPDLYNTLIKQGFLVSEELDEFSAVKEISYTVDNDDSFFHLIINPTMNCNFKCWYCYETHVKDSKMDEKTIHSTIKFVENVIATQKGIKSFSLSFFGGEPLLYFNKVIKPILSEVHALCNKKGIAFGAGMTTNGLLLEADVIEFCSKYDLDSFQITLDGNQEQHDKVRFISEGKGSYKKIVNNILQAARANLKVNVRINCSASTLTNLDEILIDFSNLSEAELRNIHFDLHKVWQVEEDLEPELEENRAIFNEKGFSVSQGAHDTVYHSCYADKRYQATLNYNGEVFKCTARDFKNGSGEGVLNGNGIVEWNEKFEKRLHSKFNNRPCMECKILPVCGGGCTQQAIEHEGVDYCVYNFDEDAKTDVVKKMFRQALAQA